MHGLSNITDFIISHKSLYQIFFNNEKSVFMYTEDEEHIPIVPMTDEQEDAMEDPVFQSLIKKAGVKPPANEQVSYVTIKVKVVVYNPDMHDCTCSSDLPFPMARWVPVQPATIDLTLDLCTRYPLRLGGPRQCGT